METFSMKATLAVVVGSITLMVAATAPIVAHHSFAAEFDAKQPVLFKGTVTKMEWINPHVWIHMNVTHPNGKTEAWMVEGGRPRSSSGADSARLRCRREPRSSSMAIAR